MISFAGPYPGETGAEVELTLRAPGSRVKEPVEVFESDFLTLAEVAGLEYLSIHLTIIDLRGYLSMY
jgi:hypothetical protein